MTSGNSISTNSSQPPPGIAVALYSGAANMFHTKDRIDGELGSRPFQGSAPGQLPVADDNPAPIANDRINPLPNSIPNSSKPMFHPAIRLSIAHTNKQTSLPPARPGPSPETVPSPLHPPPSHSSGSPASDSSSSSPAAPHYPAHQPPLPLARRIGSEHRQPNPGCRKAAAASGFVTVPLALTERDRPPRRPAVSNAPAAEGLDVVFV